MSPEALRRNSERVIKEANARRDAYEREHGSLDDYFDERWHEAVDAQETLDFLDNVYLKITDDEWKRLSAIPFIQKDLRVLKDLKEKYKISWNQLRWLHSVAPR